MFDITLERRGRIIEAAGEITIGDFKSLFTFDLSFWSPEEYRASWARSAASVLEHGFGRFLVSVGAPGAMFDTWACWRRFDEAVLLHSFLLSEVTLDFGRPEDGELLGAGTPIERDTEKYKLHGCGLAEIADFERRLRGASAQ